jgi:hypothetical protein
MICRSENLFSPARAAKTTILLMSVVFFFALAGTAAAQKRFSKTYPAGQNVRLALMNRSGTVTVEGWDRTDINISADLESPAANIIPQNLSGTIIINLVRDNQGRAEVGIVNFIVRVPYYAMVDIETRIGNVNISNVRSGLVRAKISSEGDITLTNIGASAVSAENVIGDIFFDGAIQDGGTYRFSSTRGNITLRIPFNSSFRFVATAPSTRNISLGSFASGGMSYGDGRRVIGRFGEGSATLSVTNQQGSIAFIRR